jgi:Pyruvate/2-oxoacid:ferredoxin oxidoreductase delta subunit
MWLRIYYLINLVAYLGRRMDQTNESTARAINCIVLKFNVQHLLVGMSNYADPESLVAGLGQRYSERECSHYYIAKPAYGKHSQLYCSICWCFICHHAIHWHPSCFQSALQATPRLHCTCNDVVTGHDASRYTHLVSLVTILCVCLTISYTQLFQQGEESSQNSVAALEMTWFQDIETVDSSSLASSLQAINSLLTTFAASI